MLPNNYLLKYLINQSYNSINFRSLNGEYRSNTAERCRLRRSRTPVNARTPAPSAVFMSPSPNWMTHSEFWLFLREIAQKIFFLPFLREKYLGRLDWKEDKSVLVLKLYFFYVSDYNGTTQNSNNSIYRCSEDGTLRIAIKSNPTVRPKTTSGYYTSNKQQFLWSFLYYNSKNKTLHHFPKQIPKI